MMDKFISLSVNQGDSFYLERDGKQILVDGGRSRSGFANQFVRIACTKSIDILVCTHADADHINGLLGFFEAGLSSREVWLPGTWTSRLVDLLINPHHFIYETFEQVIDLQHTEISTLEEFTESRSFSREIRPSGGTEDGETSIHSISDAIENAEDFRVERTILSGWPYIWPHRLDSTQLSLFLDAIDTAAKIRELAILAYHSGAKIRWFEYDKHQNPNGGESYLMPVNSREIFQVARPVDAFRYLTLSVANKESLSTRQV
jgi:ribonuclease BN (tRNA processing enzyme)